MQFTSRSSSSNNEKAIQFETTASCSQFIFDDVSTHQNTVKKVEDQTTTTVESFSTFDRISSNINKFMIVLHSIHSSLDWSSMWVYENVSYALPRYNVFHAIKTRFFMCFSLFVCLSRTTQWMRVCPSFCIYYNSRFEDVNGTKVTVELCTTKCSSVLNGNFSPLTCLYADRTRARAHHTQITLTTKTNQLSVQTAIKTFAFSTWL